MTASLARISTLIGLAALVALPVADAQQDARPGIAVLTFENGGSYGKNNEDYDGLRRGIPAVLLSELSADQRFRLVDRAETARVLDEQSLGASGRVDRETAARVGRLVGARYMVAGTFIDLYGDFRLDARVIDVETGEILSTVRSNPSLDDIKQLYAIIRSVAQQLGSEGKLPVRLSRAETSSPRQVPTEALVLYSRALLYEDRDDRPKAIEYYQRALDQFPDFTEAQEALRKVRGR